ncbi:hypothetical protein D3869_10105 [Azospirillum brasilense]|uniref:Uncharacterized protein n=1 Tax=Azospirillum brasilense TaxID=192 RepID=A0A4D8R470_AZOBR|nr:hypothetical protein [Azospirillum brasilense]QCO15553.1 hypothetical protein D3869_10105 [Azospirillum brasilense]
MQASDDFQRMLIASLSPSCVLPLPLPSETPAGASDGRRMDDPPASHRLALGVGIAVAVLPVPLAALA